MGAPRSIMFLILNSHSPRESLVRVMWVASWQITQRAVVSSTPLPGVKVREGASSCALAIPQAASSSARTNNLITLASRLNHEPHAMHAVPEVAERIPGRNHGLHIAAIILRARQRRHVTGF